MSDQRVRIAQWAVARDQGRLVTIGLGSCVAIALHDAERRVAGLAHVLLPDPALSHGAPVAGKAPQTAVPALVGAMREAGARGTLVAKLVGGATLFGRTLTGSGPGMGERNIAACRAALAQAGIPVVAEDVGGDSGRSVFLDVASGALVVRTVREGERVL